jgi:hypothetical protein
MHDPADDPAIVYPLTPRTSLGKYGPIRAHCSSLSQNKFLRMIPIPFPKRIRIVFSERKC